MNGIHNNQDYRGRDLRGVAFDGLFIECAFDGAQMEGMTVTTRTLFFRCTGLPAWLSKPMIGAKRGETWGEHGKVR